MAPLDHPWREDVVAAVADAGAQVRPAREASALVWLSTTPEGGLASHLHGGIRWVQLRGAGIEGWLARGVLDRDRQWTAARGIYAETVAEHALALILAGLKLLPAYARATTWDPDAKDRGRLLRDSTVLVLGAGGIGEELISYLTPIGPRVIAVTRSGREVPGADESWPASETPCLWQRADIVVVAAPATSQTRRMVGADELREMPEDALLVNVSRGSLVDTDAIAAALSSGRLGGAALDVTDPEPLPDGHPLWHEPRALITPHAANPGSAQIPRLCGLVAENIRRFSDGRRLQGIVDLDNEY